MDVIVVVAVILVVIVAVEKEESSVRTTGTVAGIRPLVTLMICGTAAAVASASAATGSPSILVVRRSILVAVVRRSTLVFVVRRSILILVLVVRRSISCTTTFLLPATSGVLVGATLLLRVLQLVHDFRIELTVVLWLASVCPRGSGGRTGGGRSEGGGGTDTDDPERFLALLRARRGHHFFIPLADQVLDSFALGHLAFQSLLAELLDRTVGGDGDVRNDGFPVGGGILFEGGCGVLDQRHRVQPFLALDLEATIIHGRGREWSQWVCEWVYE